MFLILSPRIYAAQTNENVSYKENYKENNLR